MSKFNVDFSEVYYAFKQFREDGCIYQYYEDEEYDGRTLTINNRKLLYFASCSYLGLEKHPKLIEAAKEALYKYGTQSPSSRGMLSSPLYAELEENLKFMFPGYHVVTQTVTLAHCAALPALVSGKDAIILDAYVHNSVRMASKLCSTNGTFVIISRHNDMEHIKYLIYRLKKEGYRNIWYCADGIFSVHGDKCDIPGLHKLLDEEENFYAYIDDAHGTGWCGKNGSGYVIGSYGLHEKMIVIESFAKSMVTSGGGIIVPDKILAEYIFLAGQTLVFSGPIQPATLGALIACVKLHLSDEITPMQNELIEKIKFFREKSNELGLSFVSKDISPIQLLRIGSMKKAVEVQKGLIKEGFLSSTALHPAVAKGDEGIRVTLTRHLTKTDLNDFLVCLKENMDALKIHNS